jgi:hypothetical protein
MTSSLFVSFLCLLPVSHFRGCVRVQQQTLYTSHLFRTRHDPCDTVGERGICFACKSDIHSNVRYERSYRSDKLTSPRNASDFRDFGTLFGARVAQSL